MATRINAAGGIATIEAAAGEGEKTPAISSNSYNGNSIRVPGYELPVVVDLDGLELSASHPIYRNHSEEKILGSGTTVREGNSLQTVGELTNEGPHVAEVLRLGTSGYPWQASIGAQPTRLERVPVGKRVEVNGQQFIGPLFIARESYLVEVSVVSSGADRSTSTTIAAELNNMIKETGMEFTQYVAANGFDCEALNDKQRGVLQAAFDAQGKVASSNGSVDTVIAAARDKEDRQKAYGRVIEAAINNGLDSETAEKLVQAASHDNLSETEFELQVLRLQRAPNFSSQRHSGNDLSAEVIEASLARGIGAGEVESHYRPEILEASEKRFRHGLSLMELMQMSARRNGCRDISHRDLRPLLKAAFAPVQAASGGASTYDLGGVLSNVANKMIKMGFESVESEWRKVASIAPTNDLKEQKSYALTGDFEYKEVGNGGELTHATVGEEEYSNRAKTYGRLFALTRTDFINDDLGAFNRVRRLLGRGAALSFNRVFWTEFLANASTFFTTARGNRIASSALDVDKLSAAWAKFCEQTDPDGNPLGLEPAKLIVPPGLKVTGGKLVNDPEIRIDGASAKTTYTTSNPHAGKMELVSSTYLNNANIPNGSAVNWFLAADPMDLPLIEVLFLYGRQQPTIESADADFDTLGVQLRGYHDFGVAKQEYRAGMLLEG